MNIRKISSIGAKDIADQTHAQASLLYDALKTSETPCFDGALDEKQIKCKRDDGLHIKVRTPVLPGHLVYAEQSVSLLIVEHRIMTAETLSLPISLSALRHYTLNPELKKLERERVQTITTELVNAAWLSYDGVI